MLRKTFYIAAGGLTFLLGLIGVVVRGIPTTPLMLLTLYCWTKGSPRLNAWLRGSIFYKKFLQKYDGRKGLTKKEKIGIQLFAGLMMAISFVVINILAVRIFLVICLLAQNYVFLFKIPIYCPIKNEELIHENRKEEEIDV